MLRKEYFDVIDSTVGDLQRRFMQPNFLLVRNIDLIVPMANQQHSLMILYLILRIYIDIEKLKLQLKLLPDAVKTVIPDGNLSSNIV